MIVLYSALLFAFLSGKKSNGISEYQNIEQESVFNAFSKNSIKNLTSSKQSRKSKLTLQVSVANSSSKQSELIDIVFTWVDGNDPIHVQLLKYYNSPETKNRFYNNDELKYSLRSIEKYAPWARYIFIVTNDQIPSWLDKNHPKIKLISHKQIFPNKSHLPTFNSLAIESHLHRIPGLSRRFLYFNDDILLGKPISIEDFNTPENGFKIRLAWTVPSCHYKCPYSWLGDGYCDKDCLTKSCQFDSGDCKKDQKTRASINSSSPNIGS
jgi:hypothetical protein